MPTTLIFRYHKFAFWKLLYVDLVTSLESKCISFIFSQSRRADYVSMFMEKLVSWETVSARLEMAKAQVAEREREEEKRKYEEDNENSSNGAVEMYLDSDTEDSEAA